MPKVAIISKPQKAEVAQLLPDLLAWLDSRKCEPLLDLESAASIHSPHGIHRTRLAKYAPDLIVVLGGDGTLLSASRAFARMEMPILSVNLGSLGFLTEIPISDMYATLEAWLDGSADIDARFMMHAELVRGGQMIRCWDALNDMVVAKGTIARMADYTVHIDQQFVATFRADGIIVSTPTGSTAYNLAANGPIMMPAVQAMMLTPICPHLLTIRPIVVPADATISVQIDGVPNQTYLTVDGQEAVELLLGDQIHCCKSAYSVRLLRLRPNGLFNVLRSKLKWGVR